MGSDSEQPERIVPSLTIEQPSEKQANLDDAIKTFNLLEALRAGDKATLKSLLESGSQNSTEHKIYPLHLAIGCANKETLQYVLTLPNIEINQPDQNGNTPLHLAAKSGRIDAIKLLMQHPDIDDTICNHQGRQALHFAKNPESAELLHDMRQTFITAKTKELNEAVANGDLPALLALLKNQRAARQGNVDVVKWLMEKGADVFARDKKGKLPVDVSTNEGVKSLLKEVPDTLQPTFTGQAPKMAGNLQKWTNYASGYRARWFVLENGVLSYYKNQADTDNACRGAINMRAAKLSIDPKDKTRFEIFGPGSVKYHLRADHPMEVKRWVLALTQSKQWLEEAEKTSGLHVKEPSVRRQSIDSSIIIENMSEELGTGRRGSRQEKLFSYGSRRDSIQSQSSDEETSPPYQDTYQTTVNSTMSQIAVHQNLLESVFPASYENKEVARAMHSSMSSLQQLMSTSLRMAQEREDFWQRKYTQEVDRQNFWAENFKTLAEENHQLEEIFQGTKSPMADEQSIGIAVSAAPNVDVQPTIEEEDEDDEFYDAVDENLSTLELTRRSTSHDELPGADGAEKGIAVSYKGYPSELRNSLPLDSNAARPEISLWSILKQSIGKDLTKIALPVYFNEPTSMLQRMGEDMEYSDLIDIGASHSDSLERILWVAAFAMSNYSSTEGRIGKPFNPLLGETFEYVRPDKNYRYVSEQVSHHPPISACYCESPNYNFYAEVDVKTRFWGKSFELYPAGVTHLQLKVPKSYLGKGETGEPNPDDPNTFLEHYSWKKVNTRVNNLIIGSIYLDHYGDMVITNHRTGETCTLTFKQRGWLSSDINVIEGVVKDKSGNSVWELYGKWSERLVARKVSGDKNSKPLKEAEVDNEPATSTKAAHISHDKPILLWRRDKPKGPTPFNFTQFAMTLNDTPDSLVPYLPPTDSRLRPDQKAMERGQFDLANNEKFRLEEKQRAKRRAREADPNYRWHPRWFTRETDPDTNETVWRFNHEYWKERERCGTEKIEGKGPGEWANLDDIY
ncbi:hypothetical protein K493DRAFT_359914 [Basidiobolus meristosporus CBS 931.73]|uniref:PH domain-containing protein n=1 Tax=Basidiobolus meristosporus CBS 931.73 TaxID=1314790 RepID=A0A1Y1XPV6_9FUNG|nr:hypothetical protein K493DRAFT_359914 [Basidiobolus meristosporus CBS 931.73]|eukprot:ORX87354.1 hypothetical protein K493DRAFT_359914 [Basidiobolus meristosporus CBS 931.73]